VAVKVLSREWASSSEFLERFRREAKLIAAVNHPGIAQIFTFAEEEGESYFALQWCAGGSLSQLIKKEGKISLLPALDIVIQCARALEAAAVREVVHRDIKPSNIMFDENQQIKIVDFGVAASQKIPDSNNSGDQIIGSPAYMSPEHARGDNTDQRSDIYSLGITFYQMLYGRLPFPARTPLEWISKHANDPFPRFDPMDGKVSPAAYRIVEKMTQKDSNRRYQKYSELLHDLESVRKELYLRGYLKVPRAHDIAPQASIYARTFFDVLGEIHQQYASGVLTVSWGPLQKKFLVSRNEIVLFESPQSDENFWNMLVAANLMKREWIPAAEEELEESLNRLLSQKALSPEDFKTTYRERMKSSAIQVFLWPVCEANFYKAKIEHDPFCSITIARLIMEATRTFMPFEKIDEQVPRDHLLRRTPRFESVLGELNLPRSEMFLASRLEGENITTETLQLMTGFSQEQVVRFIYAMKGLGALQYRIPTERRPRRMV
jgi:serine/threonine protein kinase